MTIETEAPVAAEIERSLTALLRPARIKRAQEMLSRRAGFDLELSGYVAMSCLDQAGPLRLSDLADATGVDVSTMSRLADRLSAAGLLEPGGDSTDRRVVGLQLSAHGRVQLATMRTVRQAALMRALDDWTDDDREMLSQLLGRFADSLEKFVRNEIDS